MLRKNMDESAACSKHVGMDVWSDRDGKDRVTNKMRRDESQE